ncbi:MAG: 4-(cytidine 5'-diphospho)-2-C-methyl-D-erythritol kinase [Lysobacterales bacterium]|jgi:4-diphosphocytidyl-2-C-methyl-D-erythritol kinase
MTDAAARYWPAPAKINLFLHVCGRREDGYHELQTLFQLLDWGDEVCIEPRDEAAIVKAGPDYGVIEDDDLAVRAARLLQSESGCRSGAEIRVRKNIPMGSGMGGGSSDAATVLLVLNELWGCGLSHDDLAALGVTLGADVPVFVRGNSALATGIGERLEAVSLGRRHYVLVFPGLSIPTPRVFADAQLKRDSEPLSPGEALAGCGRNDCTPVVRRLWPAMNEAFEKLAAWGSPRMTGTGSGIFIPVPSASEAERTAREIKSLYNCRAAAGVDRSHLHENLYTGGA